MKTPRVSPTRPGVGVERYSSGGPQLVWTVMQTATEVSLGSIGWEGGNVGSGSLETPGESHILWDVQRQLLQSNVGGVLRSPPPGREKLIWVKPSPGLGLTEGKSLTSPLGARRSPGEGGAQLSG
jgi:hypothetical protein